MTRANNWGFSTFNQNGQLTFQKLSNGRCKILDPNSPFADETGWVECVWHHHQDGKTMLPVPMETHNKSFSTGSAHTGGATIIENYPILIGFFESP